MCVCLSEERVRKVDDENIETNQREVMKVKYHLLVLIVYLTEPFFTSPLV